jgi:hypothetical protein
VGGAGDCAGVWGTDTPSSSGTDGVEETGGTAAPETGGHESAAGGGQEETGGEAFEAGGAVNTGGAPVTGGAEATGGVEETGGAEDEPVCSSVPVTNLAAGEKINAGFCFGIPDTLSCTFLDDVNTTSCESADHWWEIDWYGGTATIQDTYGSTLDDSQGTDVALVEQGVWIVRFLRFRWGDAARILHSRRGRCHSLLVRVGSRFSEIRQVWELRPTRGVVGIHNPSFVATCGSASMDRFCWLEARSSASVSRLPTCCGCLLPGMTIGDKGCLRNL